MAKEREKRPMAAEGERKGWKMGGICSRSRGRKEQGMGGMMSLPMVMRGGSAGCLSNGGSKVGLNPCAAMSWSISSVHPREIRQ